MTGMEMMLAKMLGLTPEKMQEVFAGTMKLVMELNTRMTVIETKINEIHAAQFAKQVEHKDAA